MSYSGAAMISPLRRAKPDKDILEALQDYHVVRLEGDADYNAKLVWCLEHCQNKFRDFREDERRAWYFKDEQDAMMFAMKWS
jgi:hypothetical protein